jgi:membrane protease YdiL (CAAX protease family)
MASHQMNADSKRTLAVFFAALVIVCGFFEFMAVHYKGGSFNVMWSVTIATLLAFWITKRDLRTLAWGWGPWRYQWMAFLIPLAYCTIAYAIIWAEGWGGFYNAKFVVETRERFGLTGWNDGAVLAYFLPLTAFLGIPGSLSSALGEEIGWRGFLVPELAKSMTFAKVTLISGVIWGAYHLPVIVLGNYHNNSPTALPLWAQLVMFFIGIMSASVIIAYLRLKSGSLWSAAVFHACHNLFLQRIFNPLTIEYSNTAKYVDELGLVLPLTMVPVAIYFFIKGRREFG